MVTKEGFTKDVICITLKVGGFMLFIKISYSSTPYCRYSVKPYLIINQIESILVSGQTNWAIVSKEFDDPILCNLGELLYFFVVYVFLCLWFLSQSRIHHSCGDVTITGEGVQILTYVRHLWPLSKECSLVCHTYIRL